MHKFIGVLNNPLFSKLQGRWSPISPSTPGFWFSQRISLCLKSTWKGGVNYLKPIKSKAAIPTIPTTTAVLLILCCGSGLWPATALPGQVCGDKEGLTAWVSLLTCSAVWPRWLLLCSLHSFRKNRDKLMAVWRVHIWCATFYPNFLCLGSSHWSPPVSFQRLLDLGYCCNQLCFLC